MSHARKAFALSLALSAAAAAVVRAEVTAPQLQVTELAGAVELGERDRETATFNTRSAQVMSGSVVRMTAGSARFESDNHVAVQAEKGDAFLFKSQPSLEDGTPGVLSLASMGGEPSQVKVEVSGLRLRLGAEGAVAVASEKGNSNVQVTGGRVDILDGSVLKEGESLRVLASAALGTGLRPGDSTAVMVPLEPGFQLAAVDPSRFNIARKTVTVWEEKVEPSLAAASVKGLRDEALEKVIADWPETSRQVVRVTAEKYGTPEQVTPMMMTWSDNGPWLRTVVYKNGARARFPAEHQNVIRQSIRFGVPQDKAGELAKIGIGLKFDVGSQELSAVSESEETNFLALNLAHDVVVGKLSAKEARAAYAKNISLSNAGQTVPSMQGLLF